jgi:ATP-dependent Clp protease adapter protein ClpS
MRILPLALLGVASAWAPNRGIVQFGSSRRPVMCGTDDNASSTSETQHSEHNVYLLNDSFNMREYVSRVLMMVADVSESEASTIMTRADWEGRALVGTWEKEIAQHTYDGMRKARLAASIYPADDDPGEDLNVSWYQ